MSALIAIPILRDLKRVRDVVSGVEYYYSIFLRHLSKRIRPITSLLRKTVKFVLTPVMEAIVCEIIAELTPPPSLVFPDCDAIVDGSRPSYVYGDTCIDGFGAALEQEQPNGSVRPNAYISRVNLNSNTHWTSLDLDAGSTVWAIKRSRGHLWGTKFCVCLDHKALESIGKMRDHSALVQQWLRFLLALDCTLVYRNGSANAHVGYMSVLPEPATDHDRSGCSSLTPVDDGGIFLIRDCRLRGGPSPPPGVGLGWLVPHLGNAGLGGLPFTSSKFIIFRARGPRMGIEDISAQSGTFVARASICFRHHRRSPF